MIPRDIAAYHEAGHAVAAAMLQVRVGRVTIRPEGENSGHTELEAAAHNAMPVSDQVAVLLAGQVGTWMNPAFDGNAAHPGCGGDLEAVYALLGDDGPTAFEDPRYKAGVRRAIDLLGQDRAKRAVHQLAAILLERTELVVTTDTEAAKILIHLHP